MPTYQYKCLSCEETFEVRHSMSFENQTCICCNSDNVIKIPSLSEIKISHTSTSSASRPGKIVDKYISDTKREIALEKDKLKKEQI
tara:strand:+ start:593 stop:850 length:258 start_codon:yes stop_codon:yes gene_type:complete